MSAQVLSDRTRRRIERAVGVSVDRALGFGGYVYAWRTPDHRHGWLDLRRYRAAVKAGESFPLPEGEAWGWDADPMHWSTCPPASTKG